jgi:excisionase family DNA binding protein
MQNSEYTDLITTGAAARLLEVSEPTVRKYEDEGRLPAIRAGRMRLFERATVVALAAKRRAPR